MNTEPTIRPLNIEANIYALQDVRGNLIGTGTREVCEVLLYLLSKSVSASVPERAHPPIVRNTNVRAAITL
jgi:hypothetical protein